MKKYKWTKTSIAVWNKEKLRENTTFEQRVKCDKEAAEYFTARGYSQRMEELADFYIANAGLGYRFGLGEQGTVIHPNSVRARDYLKGRLP